MEFQSVSECCVALYIGSGHASPALAASLVRSALSRAGLGIWDSMEVDMFPGDGGTLIVARPAHGMTVTVADWLLPYIER